MYAHMLTLTFERYSTKSTQMNEVSSRSHAVFIVIAEQSETVYVDEQVRDRTRTKTKT